GRCARSRMRASTSQDRPVITALPTVARRHVTCDDSSGMPTRLVIGSLVVLAACSDPPHDDHATGDGGAVLTDGSNPDGGVDPLDGQADAPALDTTPPVLVDVTPGAGEAVWLHAPIRISFDETLSP